MTAEDNTLFQAAEPTVRKLMEMTADERERLYGFLWSYAVSQSFGLGSSIADAGVHVTDSSDWSPWGNDAFIQELASMCDLYGPVTPAGLDVATVRALLRLFHWDSSLEPEQLRARIAWCKAKFWRGNTNLELPT